MKKYIILFILCMSALSISAQEIQYAPQNFEGFKGLNLDGEEFKIGVYEASDMDGVLVNKDGSIEKWPGYVQKGIFSSDEVNTFTYTTEADFALGETKTVDYTTYSGTVTLSSTADSWVQGSVTDFDAADSLVDIDSTTYSGMLTIANVDAAADTASATATASESYSISYYPSNANDRDTGYFNTAFIASNSTVLLIHCDGTNGSTAFTDDSITAKVLTTHGGARIRSDTYVFNGASGYFDGSGDYLSTPDDAGFDFGSGNFTIEWWMMYDDVSRDEFPMSARSGSGWLIRHAANSEIKIHTGAEYLETVGAGFVNNKWYHVAFEKIAGTFKIFVNGVTKLSTVNGTAINGDAQLEVAAYGGAYEFAGYLDEIRISKGIARYASDFSVNTPPAVPTSWKSARQPNTHTLNIELSETLPICSAGWYAPYKELSPNTFDIQYSLDNSTWDTALAVVGLADTITWGETFTGVYAKYWRLYCYGSGSDTQFNVGEFYLLPQGVYISQCNTDVNVINGMLTDFTVSETLNRGFIDYYLKTEEVGYDTESWTQIADENMTLKARFQVKVLLTPKLIDTMTIYAPTFETFTLDFQYMNSLTGQWVSDVIDRGTGTYLLPGYFKFTSSDSNTTGTSIVYYVKCSESSDSIDSATWVYTKNDSITTTNSEFVKIRADLSSDTVLYTPYLYSLGITTQDSNVAQAIFGLYPYSKSSGVNYLLTNCESSVYYSQDGINFTLLQSGFTGNLEMCYTTISDTQGNETCVFSNGTDNRFAWDETNLREYSGSEQISPNVMAFMQGYLFGAIKTSPNRLYHSLQWHATDLGDTNYILVPIPSGEWIVSLTPMSRLADDITSYLVIQSQTTTWLLKNIATEISAANLEPVFSELGGSGHYGSATIEKTLYWPSNRGIYTFDGANAPTNIGQNIQSVYDDFGQISTAQSYWLTTTQEDWQAGETKTNIDTTTYFGNIIDNINISKFDIELPNYGFENNNIGYWDNTYGWKINSTFVLWGSYSAARSQSIPPYTYSYYPAGYVEWIKNNWIRNWYYEIKTIGGGTTTTSGIISLSESWVSVELPLYLYAGKSVEIKIIYLNYYSIPLYDITKDIFVSNGTRWNIAARAYSEDSHVSGQFNHGYIDGYSDKVTKIYHNNTATYISAVHNTGTDTPYYGIFEADYDAKGQTVSFSVQTDTDNIGWDDREWHTATAGQYITNLDNYRYVRYKIDMSTGDTTISPSINSVRINYGTNSAINQASMQGIWWDDYYLFACAKDGSVYNNVVYAYNIRNGQWMKKTGWYVNRWARFMDMLYFGDSRYGLIYRAWIGYNDNGNPIISKYKTKAFNFGVPYTKKELRSIYTTVKTGSDTANLYVYCYTDNQELSTVNTIPLYAPPDIVRRINKIEMSPEFYYINLMFYQPDLNINFKLYDYQWGIKPLNLLEGDFIDLK